MSEQVLESSAPRARTPIHLWIVGLLSLLWGAMGALDYLAAQMRWDFYMSQFSEEQLEYFYGFPAWMVAGWALAVWAGLAGAVGLLMRRSWAVWMYVLSLVGMAISTFYNFILTDGGEVMGSGATVFSVVIWVVAIALLLYSRRQAMRGVLA